MNMHKGEDAAIENFPIHELEQIESTIAAAVKCLRAMHERRDTLIDELERVTRPAPLLPEPRRIEIGPGYDYRGTLTRRWAAIDIYLDLLRRLWIDFPERRKEMAAAMGARGATRTYVATTRAGLFPQRHLGWAMQHSRPLVEGWYADTNLSRERMRVLLPAAVAAAGLKWRQDVKVYWARTVLPVADN